MGKPSKEEEQQHVGSPSVGTSKDTDQSVTVQPGDTTKPNKPSKKKPHKNQCGCQKPNEVNLPSFGDVVAEIANKDKGGAPLFGNKPPFLKTVAEMVIDDDDDDDLDENVIIKEKFHGYKQGNDADESITLDSESPLATSFGLPEGLPEGFSKALQTVEAIMGNSSVKEECCNAQKTETTPQQQEPLQDLIEFIFTTLKK